jgi:hypothetical protein
MKFNLNKLQYVISIVIALLVSYVVEYYFSMSGSYLIPVAAVLVMLTSIGNMIYQGIIRFFLLVIVVVVVSVILPSHHMIYVRLYDVCLGALIGIACNFFIFPRRADREFRDSVLAILRAYEAYFVSLMNSIFEKDEVTLEIKKIEVEYQLQQFPNWVYAKGFDVGLKEGHQYFLMKLFHVAEILFAMQNAVRCRYDVEVVEVMRESVMICADKVKTFFNALITVFELKKLKEGVEDFEEQLHDLDTRFQTLIPTHVNLLDMSQDDVLFYEIIYTLNDLRKALMKLGQALR